MLRASIGISILAVIVVLAHSEPAVAQSTPGRDLAVVSWGGSYTRSQMLAYVKPFRAESGKWVRMETYNGGLKEIREQVESANITWDVVDFELADLIKGCREGLLEKIDHSRLPAGADGTPASEDFISGAFTDCGVGQVIWATVVGYDTTKVGKKPPTKLADFFDVKAYPGKRGLRRDPRIVLEWALMADGVSPDKVYSTLESDDGLKRAFSVLNRIRRHIVWWQTGTEPVSLLESGDVVMTSVWNGRMYRPIVEQSKSFSILWDGQIWDIDSWGIVKGTDNLNESLAFVRFATDTKQLAEQTKYIPYGPARKSSMALVGEKVKAMLPTAHMANALPTNAQWWATHHAELSEKFERWYRGGGSPLSGTAR